MAKPFIKWAGGKTYLLPRICELLDQHDVSNLEYHEPMVGGGAILYGVSDRFKSISINDINDELINCYVVIRDHVEELIVELNNGSYAFQEKGDQTSKDNYHRIRASTPVEPVQQAARTMFLLKTCFNGLMRKNKAGRFNVPMGSYKNPVVCDTTRLRECSEFLHNVKISHGDAIQYISNITNVNSFLFVDPPYHDEAVKKRFINYSGDFTEADQIKLINAIITSKCKFIYTNRATKLIKGTFSGFRMLEIPLKHSIQPKYTTDVVETELLVYNL